MSIKDFAEKFTKGYRAASLYGSIDDFQTLFDPDFTHHAQPGLDFDLPAYMQHVIEIRTKSEVLQVDFKYLTGEGNIFVVELNSRYKLTSDMPGLPSTAGKVVTSHFLFVFKTRNQKIIEGWSDGGFTVLE